jgi:hypothetical protein
MATPIFMSQAQIDLMKKITAFSSKLDDDERLRGNPAAIDIGRAMIGMAAEMAIPPVTYKQLGVYVAEYDEFEVQPPHRRPLWFQPRAGADADAE